jgi:hypothetical protein
VAAARAECRALHGLALACLIAEAASTKKQFDGHQRRVPRAVATSGCKLGHGYRSSPIPTRQLPPLCLGLSWQSVLRRFDVVCGTVAEGSEIGECGLGVRTRVG